MINDYPADFSVSSPNKWCNGETKMASRWAMDKDNVNTLINQLGSSNFIENIPKLFDNPMQNILSLKCYPFDVKTWSGYARTLPDAPVVINTVTLSGVYGCEIQPDNTYAVLNVGDTYILRPHNSFLDYAPYTTYEVFLPYIGSTNLDNNLVAGKYLHIRYAVDLRTGALTAYLLVSEGLNDTANFKLISQHDGHIGIDVPVAGGSGLNLDKAMISALTSIGSKTGGLMTTLASGIVSDVKNIGKDKPYQSNPYVIGLSVGALLSTVGELAPNTSLVNKGGGGTPNTGIYGPQNAILYITTVVLAEPSNYAHSYGRPLNATKTLSQLSGYTTVASVHIEGVGFNTATETEKLQIETFLKSGVIL